MREKCKLRKITLSLNKNNRDRRYNAVVIVKLKKRLLFESLEFNFDNFEDSRILKTIQLFKDIYTKWRSFHILIL